MVDAGDQFLGALEGVHDPEEKRKIIGREFIRVFEAAEVRVFADVAEERDTAYLVQGTLYPDVVESGGGAGTSNIKSHHNVGGLPDDLAFELVEPLRTLFKDEVRLVGEQLGLPSTMVWRQPFPGPGLGIRIIGEVTRERLDILRQADAIAREELTRAGLDRDIWQMPVVLLADVRSVGVQGDGRTYGHPVVIRPVTSEDAMTADWARLPYDVLERISTRITNEVAEINRVTLDVTSKPPGTIEWEWPGEHESMFTAILRARAWGDGESVSGSRLRTGPYRRPPRAAAGAAGPAARAVDPGRRLRRLSLDAGRRAARASLRRRRRGARPDRAAQRREHARRRRRFLHADITRDPLPRADLVLCREVLFHFPDDDVLRALGNLRARTRATWLLTTSFRAHRRTRRSRSGAGGVRSTSRPSRSGSRRRWTRAR